MLKTKAGVLVAAALILGVFCVSDALAQGGGGGGGGGGRRGAGGAGGGGGRGNFDPNMIAQMQMDRMKTTLGATDEEMTALWPLIQKVQTLRQDMQGGGRGGMGGGRRGAGGAGGAGAAAAPAPTTDVGKAVAALNALLANADAAPGDIKTALQALRDARAKVKVQLDEAQKALKAVLTILQEAKLVVAGTID